MKKLSLATVLTVINLVLMFFLLTELQPARAQYQQPGVLPVLRGRALEIVDSMGKVRASITIQPAVEKDGRKYSQTVLLRLIDTQGKPSVKLGLGDSDGSGLFLSDGTDDGIVFRASDTATYIKMTNRKKTQLIKL